MFFFLLLTSLGILSGCQSGSGDSGGSSGPAGDSGETATANTPSEGGREPVNRVDGCTDFSDPSCAGPKSYKAMWIWGSETVLNPGRQDELAAFIVEKGITRLYLGAWTALQLYQEELAAFIRRFAADGVAVELLFGDPAWALYDNHFRVMDIVDQVVDFTARYPDAKPAGLHVDVEPYLLPQWESERALLANQFIDLFEKIAARLENAELPFIADIPIWYDVHDISRNGIVRPLHELVIDTVDGVGLMDYRDSEEGIVRDAQEELGYASATGKQVVVGVETMCIEPTSITFCEEGATVMEEILDNVDIQLSEFTAYAGHAIHYFDSYRKLWR